MAAYDDPSPSESGAHCLLLHQFIQNLLAFFVELKKFRRRLRFFFIRTGNNIISSAIFNLFVFERIRNWMRSSAENKRVLFSVYMILFPKVNV